MRLANTTKLTYDIAASGGELIKWTDTINITKTIHPLWTDWLKYKDNLNMSQRMRESPLAGKWHYIYESQKGIISLIVLLDYFRDGVDWWEIHGNPIEDVERFLSKEEAEVRIKELLE
jgi:hypothetical protein